MVGRTFLSPDFYCVVHTNEADITLYTRHLQVTFWEQDASVPVRGHNFRVTYELAENHLLFGVPFIQPAAKLVLSGKPYTFRVEHQAILIHVLTQHESFFRSGLQLFPEGGRDENSSFCIRLSLDIT